MHLAGGLHVADKTLISMYPKSSFAIALQIYPIPHFEKTTLTTSITFGSLVYEITSVSPDGSRYG